MNPRTRRVVAIVAGVLASALTARLGVWQLDRASQKIARQQLIDSRAHLPALPPAELARTPDEAAGQWQRSFVVQGEWLPQATVFLDNRPLGGQSGFHVVTPLRLAADPEGRALVVLRGWTPRDPAVRTHVPDVPTPSGTVTLRGHLAPWPSPLFDLGAETPGPIRQNLDAAMYRQEAGLPLAPLVLQLDDEPSGHAGNAADANTAPASSRKAAPDGLRREWPAPAVDVHKHYGYAVQWFAMSALALGLTLWFQLIRPYVRTARAARQPTGPT